MSFNNFSLIAILNETKCKLLLLFVEHTTQAEDTCQNLPYTHFYKRLPVKASPYKYLLK